MAGEVRVLKRAEEYQLLDLVFHAYSKLATSVAKKSDDFGITESQLYDDEVVANVLVSNAEKFGIKGITAQHVKFAMNAAKTFAGDSSSGAEALAKVANDKAIYQEYKTSEAAFYDRQAVEGKTILDKPNDYADILKIVDTYGNIIGDVEQMEALGLTRESSGQDWKGALKRRCAFAMNDEDFERAWINAGRVVSSGEVGVNAIASLHENNKPLVDSYKKFTARSNADLEAMHAQTDGGKAEWLKSRKENRKAKRTIFGSFLGKALMFLAVPGAIVGLFFGAAALAGGVAALSSVASLGIVLGTGLIGYLGYNIFKKPFQKLWDRLTKKQDTARALLGADEHVLGSSKHRKHSRSLYRQKRMAFEKANANMRGLSAEDTKLLGQLVNGETLEINNIDVGLSDEHFVEGAKKVKPVVEGEIENTDEGEHVLEKTDEPETSSPDMPTLDERRNTHGVIVTEAAKSFHNLTEQESEKLSNSAIKQYVNRLADAYEAEHQGVTISKEARDLMAEKAAQAYVEYVTYNDKIANSKLRRQKRKDAEVSKLQNVEHVVTIKEADGKLKSVTFDLSGEDVANEVNIVVESTAVKNSVERAVRKEIQESYEKSTGGSAVAKDVVDAALAEIATKNGVDLNSLKSYLGQKLGDDEQYVHAGVNKMDATAGRVEIDNDGLKNIATDVKKLEALGAETSQKMAELQQERQQVRTSGIDEKYQKFVSDQLVERAIDAYVESNYSGADAKEKAKLAADLKTYYLAEKPYVDGKVGVPILAEIEGGKVIKPSREGVNAALKTMVEEAAQRVDAMKSDKERYDEIQKFQKECDKVGLQTPNGIIAQFVERIETDIELQNRLGEENLSKLREIVKSNSKVAKSVEEYMKSVPSSERASVAETGRGLEKDAKDFADEKFVLDMCHDVFVPHKEEARKKRIAQIEAEKQAEEERLAAERAEKQKLKEEKKLARELKRATVKAKLTNEEETPHETERGEE